MKRNEDGLVPLQMLPGDAVTSMKSQFRNMLQVDCNQVFPILLHYFPQAASIKATSTIDSHRGGL